MQQCSGDVHPQAYGGSFYRVNEYGEIEILVVQPVLEYVSEDDARESGLLPYWAKQVLVEPEEVRELLENPGFRRWLGLELYEGEGYGQDGDVYIRLDEDRPEVLAAIACDDVGYGALCWIELDNQTGEQLALNYNLPDLDEWVEADKEYLND